ncbi:MAG TPA: YdiU family protein [Steroidobacteraceae bacterium]|jgi:uncharacterized protein YdiU (UPF0061 family)|nr:YdiU family protein [Steroidobacteraceae bacterium]
MRSAGKCVQLDGLHPAAYGALPERFYARLDPAPAANPRLIKLNEALARELGLGTDALSAEEQARLFSGSAVPCGVQPLAAAYAGHQFGGFVPQLGDGRAILLGDALGGGGRPYDVQLKGSGRTPYSRGGDGRAAVGPVLREFLVSEAMHALGIPSTRTLAAVTTGESVYREVPLPGAVLTRVAASHVRVGTFQYFAARGDVDGVRTLADYAIARHYPEIQGAARPQLELLRAVTRAQAGLIARWMRVGFIHGVMNTDNMAVSGETIDFGPCAFMDEFDPLKVFSSIDSHGRYAYANQPHVAAWNLTRFAETLLPLIDADTDRAVALASEVLEEFGPRYSELLVEGMRAKIGLAGSREDEDGALIEALLDAMHAGEADFTLTFRGLSELGVGAGIGGLFANAAGFEAWLERWRARLARDPTSPAERADRMRAVNPVYIPRNHRIEQVITAAVEHGDFAPFEAMAAALARPYEERAGLEKYAQPPSRAERVTKTFCGT